MSRPRRTVPELVADEWLVELAARDEPQTVIEPQLLARFARAGVVRLVPSDGTESLAPDDAARAIGIGAHGPGFGFGESYEDESAPAAAALARLCKFVERFDRLRRLRLAAVDMGFVASTARQLADRLGPARLFERVLETGLVVTYAPKPRVEPGGRWPQVAAGERGRPEAARLDHRRAARPVPRARRPNAAAHADRHDRVSRARRAANLRRGMVAPDRRRARADRRSRRAAGSTIRRGRAQGRRRARRGTRPPNGRGDV